jgi:hypothetical protein
LGLAGGLGGFFAVGSPVRSGRLLPEYSFIPPFLLAKTFKTGLLIVRQQAALFLMECPQISALHALCVSLLVHESHIYDVTSLIEDNEREDIIETLYHSSVLPPFS